MRSAHRQGQIYNARSAWDDTVSKLQTPRPLHTRHLRETRWNAQQMDGRGIPNTEERQPKVPAATARGKKPPSLGAMWRGAAEGRKGHIGGCPCVGRGQERGRGYKLIGARAWVVEAAGRLGEGSGGLATRRLPSREKRSGTEVDPVRLFTTLWGRLSVFLCGPVFGHPTSLV